MATDDDQNDGPSDAIAEGLETEGANFTSIIKETLRGNAPGAVIETVGFLRRLVSEETPETEDEIMELSKDEVVLTIYRVNLFEKLRHPVLDDEQLECLYDRTIELWGEAPTEPTGRWAEWNLWVTLHRRRNGIAITDVIEGKKTVEDIQQQWIDRHEERENRRKHHKLVNYEKYGTPEEVPSSLKHLIFSPFLKEDEEVPEVEIDEEEISDAYPAAVREETLENDR